MKPKDTALSARIKRLRLQRNESQASVARGMGMSQPSYHALECGATRPTLLHLVKLCTHFDVPVAEAFPDYALSADEALIASVPWKHGAGPDDRLGSRVA